MKKYILSCICLFCISNFIFSQSKLDIEINGLKNNTGNVMLQLFDSTEKVITQEIITIKENRSAVSIPDLSPGRYAVRYYHDENMNGKMETNLVGKPMEGYGFSNNVIGKLGPPPFKKWLFEVTRDTTIILLPTY